MRTWLLLTLLLSAPSVWAQERLTLTVPETETIAASWTVRNLHIDAEAPSLEVTLVSDTGRRFIWRLVVDEEAEVPVTLTMVRAAIQFINRGDFRPLGKTLQQWLLEELVRRGVKAGTVTQ